MKLLFSALGWIGALTVFAVLFALLVGLVNSNLWPLAVVLVVLALVG